MSVKQIAYMNSVAVSISSALHSGVSCVMVMIGNNYEKRISCTTRNEIHTHASN